MAEPVAQRPRRPVSIAGRPIYAMLLPIAVVCFLGALLTDLAYGGSGGNLLWLNFSSWLLAAGLFFGAFVAIALLIDAIRMSGPWLAFALLIAAWVVELINSFIHTRDGWTAVHPSGLVLSIIGAVLMLGSGWFAPAHRHAIEGERR
jgi:uncharacterized membrane protein